MLIYYEPPLPTVQQSDIHLSDFFVLFILVNLLEGIERKYDEPEKQYKFMTINCLFCEKKCMYEQTLLSHLNYVHFKQGTDVPRERSKVNYS